MNFLGPSGHWIPLGVFMLKGEASIMDLFIVTMAENKGTRKIDHSVDRPIQGVE